MVHEKKMWVASASPSANVKSASHPCRFAAWARLLDETSMNGVSRYSHAVAMPVSSSGAFQYEFSDLISEL